MSAPLKTNAVVINSIPYGDSDLIVTFMTGEHGVIKGMAKGARKSRKRFAGCFEPFNEITLGARLKETGGLAAVDTADVVDAHPGIRDSLDKIGSGMAMLELTAAFEAPGPGSAKELRLLKEGLRLLEASDGPRELCAAFFVKYLAVAGYKIPFGRCAGCNAGLG
ncbi:MAG TPA: DNA repair protein RecO, partial [Nitrospirota bacterium]|nr:DNA repair protein RecO [Nitrospirota bacterium]